MPEVNEQNIVEKQFEELVESYTGFRLTKNKDGSFLISGDFLLDAEFNGETLKDKFALELMVPSNYPSQIPIVKEIGGRIPREEEYHVNPDGSLCLNVPLELRKIFHEKGTLLNFVQRSVVHFLYAFCYRQKFGEMPYGEWSHGGEGLVEYYSEVFKVVDPVKVLGLLKILADNDFQRQQLCPCGSKLKLRRCHGGQLREILTLQEPGHFMYDYLQVIGHLVDEKQVIPRHFISKTIQRHSERSLSDS